MVATVYWLLITIILRLAECEGARILAVLPMGSHSHQNTYRPIFRELAKRGHDITYVTSIPDDKAPYKQIVIDDTVLSAIAINTNLFEMRKNTWIDSLLFLSDFGEETTAAYLSSPKLKQLIHSTDLHFDLVFTESFMVQEAFITFGHKFKAPLIELTGLCPSFWLYHLMSNPYSFSYTVDFETTTSDKMTFMERLRNTMIGTASLLFKYYYHLPKQEALAEKYFKYPGYETRPPLVDMLSNVSLVLQNTHIATHYPHPYNPNVVEIGGIQLQEPGKLPQDLKTYLDKAKEGVIFFSFGSVLNGSLMPENMKQAFLSGFAELPYKVLWKWEAEKLENKPENVKISKWLPQKDILAHPNVKVFITHGGLASMTEFIYHGVPAVVIPVFCDQWKNSKKIEAEGLGIILDFDNVTTESVVWATKSVATQPAYREAAQRQSKILRDNPMRPVERAIYWIEYVLRHKSTPHLRTAATGLPWYKYYLIDVVAVLILFVLLVLIIVYLILRTLYSLICGRKTEQIKTLKKKKN